MPDKINNKDFGLIGFFDILGYTNIIENNQIEYVSKIVTDQLIKVPELISEKIHDIGQEESTKDLLKTFTKRFKWVVFSDIVLLALPKEPTKPLEDFDYSFFFIACAALQRMMFDAGLPIKGAISVGPFYIHDRCFAGQPIIDCYKLSKEVDFAACVLHETAAAELETVLVGDKTEKALEERAFTDGYLLSYLVPFKDKTTKRYKCLRWGFGNDRFKPFDGDIRELIINAFSKHNKDIPPSVYPKIENTEIFLRFVKQNLSTQTMDAASRK